MYGFYDSISALGSRRGFIQPVPMWVWDLWIKALWKESSPLRGVYAREALA